jgi:broad specificity phosphatase PhoE
MFKRICKITFITHGATVYSLDSIINDVLKYPKLNDIGENEIQKVCACIESRGVVYDKIYSSPSACFEQSANIIATYFKQKSKTIDLKTRNHGDWQGLSYNDIFKKYGIEGLVQTPPNGEPIEDFNRRVSDVINKLVDENKGNRILVITTPEVVQSALAQTLDLTPINQHKILIKTGSLTQISYFKGWSSVIYSDFKLFN